MNKKLTVEEINQLPENTFGERLHKLRETLGISQELFSELLNCSTKTLSRYETGATSPRVNDLMHLCEELQVPVSHLLKQASLEDLDEKLTSIIMLLTTMTPTQIDYFEKSLRLYLQNHVT